MHQQIMIAVDGSPSSLHAVRHAVRLAQAGLHIQVTLVHAQAPASLLELATQDTDAIAQAALDAGAHLMAPAVAILDAAGISYTTEVVLGEVGPVLVDMAAQLQVDMVIVGAQGLGALERVLMGSVSRDVLNHCSAPVLVVRLPEAPTEPIDDDVSEDAA